jgi:hypothetical protein
MHFGLILPNLGLHQLAFQSLCSINSLIDAQTPHTFSIFQEDIEHAVVTPKASVFNLINIVDFDGILIATTIDNCITMRKSTTTARQMFYVWDLEWTRSTHNYLHSVQAFHGVDLIARSEEHAKAITGFSNRHCAAIIPDINFASIIEWVENEVDE